jgi:hypothetical protein
MKDIRQLVPDAALNGKPQCRETTQLQSSAGPGLDPESGMAALPRFWKIPAIQVSTPNQTLGAML